MNAQMHLQMFDDPSAICTIVYSPNMVSKCSYVIMLAI